MFIFGVGPCRPVLPPACREPRRVLGLDQAEPLGPDTGAGEAVDDPADLVDIPSFISMEQRRAANRVLSKETQ